MKRVALVASEKREFRGLLKRFGPGQAMPCGVQYSRRLHGGGLEWLLYANGQGCAAAERACAAIEGWDTLDAVGSIGYAGGLRPSWQIGDVLLGDTIRDRQTGENFACWLPGHAALPTGKVLTVERVVRHAAEKQALGCEGADVVEMEAAAVARAVRVRGGVHSPRLFAVKVISDTSEEDLAIDFERARRADGTIRTASVLAQAFERPWVKLPQLGKLAKVAYSASDKLGAALAALFSGTEKMGVR